MALGRWINPLKGQRSVGAEAKEQEVPARLRCRESFKKHKDVRSAQLHHGTSPWDRARAGASSLILKGKIALK